MKIPEIKIQESVQKMLSDPSQIFSTSSGKRLQILSPGRLNRSEGPDLLDIAVLLNGTVMVGDAEFHRFASDWRKHGHSSDQRYNSVILHIVFRDDCPPIRGIETLIVDEHEAMKIPPRSEESVPDELEDLQHYALLRLLRKSSDAQKLLTKYDLKETLLLFSREFVDHYAGKMRRPAYTDSELAKFVAAITESKVFDYLNVIASGDEISIQDIMQSMLKSRIANEGSHLRQELIINAILPLSLCIACEEARINLFLWFWSTPAPSKYGVLARQYPNLPQNFVWQQQGMLEYYKEHGRKANIIKDVMTEYGFAEVLSFYRLGRAPFKEMEEA